MDESIQSKGGTRRRAHGELGIFSKAAVACVSPQLLENNKAAMCMDNSIDQTLEYKERYVPVAKAKVKKVKDTYGPVVKESAVDFAMTAAEAYRQECKSEKQNRGGDELFFQNPNATTPYPDEPNNSLLAGSGNRSHDGSLSLLDEKKEPVFDPWGEKKDSLFDGEEEESDVNLNGGGIPFIKEKKQNANLLSRYNYSNDNGADVDRPQAPVRRRFPNTNELMGRTGSLTPPRVARSVDKSPFQSGSAGGKHELRATRMELFRQGQEGKNSSSSESRLTKALVDLEQQDSTVDALKRQLELTQSELDEAHNKLDQAHRMAQENNFRGNQVQRRQMAGRHQEETAQTDHLQQIIANLKLEIATLQQQAQERDRSATRGLPSLSASFDGASRGGTTNKNQMISLRAEIVELRSQLAEAHASNIDDNASVRTFEELDDLKQKLQDTEDELRSIKNKEQNFQKLQEQMFLLQYEANDTKKRLENQLQDASKVELELRSELSKTKSSLHKLENESSRRRLFNSAGGNKQLQTAREEIAKLKEELGQEKKNAKHDLDNLSKELEEVKHKLMISDDELVDVKAQALSDRKKMQDGMREQSETVRSMQQQIQSKDEKMIAHLRKISELEALLADNGVDSSAHLKKISSLERKVAQLESSERRLQQELELQKNLLKEERDQASKKAGASVDKESVRRLKERMERVRAFESPNPTRGDVDSVMRETALKKQIEALNAKVTSLQKSQSSDGVKEEILLNEIASLKAKLRQTESSGKEEKLRSEAERRMSRDLSTGHSRELERLRQEQLETLAAKNKMEQELMELRKKLMEATQSNVQTATAKAKESEGAEVTVKVNRLRNELAVARNRLVTAREQSRAFDGDSISTKNSTPQRRPVSLPQSPASPVESSVSQGSSWAPPNINRLRVVIKQPSNPTEPEGIKNETASVPLPALPAATAASNTTKSPPTKILVASTLRSSAVITPEATASSSTTKSPPTKILVASTLRSPAVITPEKAEVLPRAIPPAYGSSKSRSSSTDLRQRLEASRRRLDNANVKLEKLLAPGNFVIVEEEKNESLLDEVLGQ
ncbi:unnamed protein product [Cylindrotheca closterium]|uniref:Uncharacterized protein n=1 Tax=Cylindrotheca closterium TaxID=2856 RepID=A0AAD2CSQ9_9STRA|nr:unnamed protein product [Cylindrotheca closterium]